MTHSYDLKNNWPDSHNGYRTYQTALQAPSYQETDIVGLLYRCTRADQPFSTLDTAAWKSMKQVAKKDFARIMYNVKPNDLPLHGRGEFEQMWNDARTKVLVKEAQGQQVNDSEPTEDQKPEFGVHEQAVMAAQDAVSIKAALREQLKVLQEQGQELEEAKARAKDSVGRKRKHDDIEQWVDNVQDVDLNDQGLDDGLEFLV